MRKILVTGALGQIGSELVVELRRLKGAENVIASDIRLPPGDLALDGPFEFLDATNARQVHDLVRRYDVGTIYHLAALLSATSEEKPHVAWELNMGGLYKIARGRPPGALRGLLPELDRAPSDPRRPASRRRRTPCSGRPRCTASPRWRASCSCDYYASRFGVDMRGLRFPGLISHSAPPGGGTTDYAVAIFYEALRHGRYTCFLGPDTRLDMMYMPDAIRATVELMEADPARLMHRNAFNIAAMNFTPVELAAEIRKHIPGFTIDYDDRPGAPAHRQLLARVARRLRGPRGMGLGAALRPRGDGRRDAQGAAHQASYRLTFRRLATLEAARPYRDREVPMPHDRFLAALANDLAVLDARGNPKRYELVIEGVVPAAEGYGPRYRVAGRGGELFLKMNSNNYLGMNLRAR